MPESDAALSASAQQDGPGSTSRSGEVEPVIELRGVEKHYQMGSFVVKALRGVDLKIFPVTICPFSVLRAAESRPC